MSAVAVERGRLDAAPSRVRVPFAVGAVAGAVLLALSAFVAIERPAPPPARPPAAPSDRVSLLVAGIPAEVTPEAQLAVAGTITARVAVVRVASRAGARDLHLTVTDANGPLDGARISVTGQMRYMDHGTFDTTGEPDGPGSYVVHLVFAMPGEYELRLIVASGATAGTLLLDLDLPN